MACCKDARYMQYVSAIVATMPIASGVMYALWAGPSLPKLASSDSPVGYPITVAETSWLVSCVALGGACVALFTMFFVDIMGRRTWLLICGVCLSVPWIIIYFAKNVPLICIARFTGGVGSSAAFMTAPVYIAEIVDKDMRGKLAITGGIAGLVGSVFTLTVGPFISYYNLALACFVFPTVFIVLFYFLPESPYYQVKKGEKKAALRTLTILSSRTTPVSAIERRLEEIEESVAIDMQQKQNIWECVSKKQYRKSLIIMLGTKTLLQLSGTLVIDSFAQSIIAKTNSIISPEISSLLFGAIQIPAAVFASCLVDRLGRRPLWLISAVGCAIGLFGEGLYFILSDTDSLTWLPTASILLFLVMCPIGIGTLPFVIVGEIFSSNIKGAAISLSTLYGSILAFLVLTFAERAAVALGRYTVLWFFSCVCVLGVFFIIFIVPETKGKSLEEIQEMLNKDRRRISIKDDSSTA